jgi:hypothetical protein
VEKAGGRCRGLGKRGEDNVVRRGVGAEYGAEWLVERGLRRGGGGRCRGARDGEVTGIEELGCGAGRAAGGCCEIEERWSTAGWKTVALCRGVVYLGRAAGLKNGECRGVEER